MKTKYDIINDLMKEKDYSGFMIRTDFNSIISPAMEEYAKQECRGLIDFIHDNYQVDDHNYYKTSRHGIQYYTHDQVYTEYLQSKKPTP